MQNKAASYIYKYPRPSLLANVVLNRMDGWQIITGATEPDS